jgi:hypothetical protein
VERLHESVSPGTLQRAPHCVALAADTNVDDFLRILAVPQGKGKCFRDMPGACGKGVVTFPPCLAYVSRVV